MRNLLSGLVSGAGLVILWAVLTKPKSSDVITEQHIRDAVGDPIADWTFTDNWLRLPGEGWSGPIRVDLQMGIEECPVHGEGCKPWILEQHVEQAQQYGAASNGVD